MPIFRLEGNDISNSKLIIAQETDLELESHLEDWLENSPWALIQNELVLWIGRQTSASVDDRTIFPDLLGVDVEGNLVIVELKRDKAPRDVVAQLLEYAAWAHELTDRQIQQIAGSYFEVHDKFEGMGFVDIFTETFELVESNEFPPLNQNLRLYIIAANIPAGVSQVCRFLRTSHGVDINCIDVSTFETETGERLISMEMIVGDEDVSITKTQRKITSRFSQWSKETERQIIWEAVIELTDGNTDIEFNMKHVKDIVLRKYSKFNPNTVMGILVSDTVNNDPSFPSSGENKYWRVKPGIYRLYDSHNNNEEGGTDTSNI